MNPPQHQIEYVTVGAPRWWLWYLIGGVLVALAVIVPCSGVIVVGLYATPRGGDEFTPPATVSYAATKVGQHFVWIDAPDTSGSGWSPGPSVPEKFSVTVTGPDGGAIPVMAISDTESQTMRSKRTGAAMFSVPAVGNYTVDVKTTLPSGQAIAITPDPESDLMKLGAGMIALFGLAVLMFVAGVVLLIVTGVRHAHYQG